MMDDVVVGWMVVLVCWYVGVVLLLVDWMLLVGVLCVLLGCYGCIVFIYDGEELVLLFDVDLCVIVWCDLVVLDVVVGLDVIWLFCLDVLVL